MSDPTSLPNFPPPADEHPLRGRVLDALKDLGLDPNIDADGDVAFTVGEPAQQLFVRCQDGDFPIMRIFGQWMISDRVPPDPLLRLQRCNDFSLQLNLVKVGIANDNLIVSGEHVVPMGGDIPMLIQITVNIIMEVVQMWHTSFLSPEEQQQLAEQAGNAGSPGDPGTNGSGGAEGVGGTDGTEGPLSSSPGDDYQPRHRPSDEV
ncbi:hypothetical protein [Lapillicoccus sp.]|uniref:hypothetical protein n=1 Tax=Lapillicoccus sp. TaxID=1909287 RepID=UPI0025D1E25C|nr:hypothetical protein [Lapillicoccus sp.]